MAKLCPKGKAAAKRKFKVYPSAYANMYASAVCSGKVTPGGKKNRVKRANGDPNPREINPNVNPKSKTSRREKELLMEINRKTDSGMRKKAMGGGMMNRPMYGKGGGVCIRGMNRQAVGKNS